VSASRQSGSSGSVSIHCITAICSSATYIDREIDR
jgi:hypothetical protein